MEILMLLRLIISGTGYIHLILNGATHLKLHKIFLKDNIFTDKMIYIFL